MVSCRLQFQCVHKKSFNLSLPICAIFTRVVVNAKIAITTRNVSQCASSNDDFCQNVRISFSVKLSARSTVPE